VESLSPLLILGVAPNVGIFGTGGVPLRDRGLKGLKKREKRLRRKVGKNG
tara:strand:- start:272 stop:421 length:150 start_codon:yes stop_codon:yes gene_type:complete